ncbi:hypothetical protein QFC21_001782 [Naganishia friedmannii]|uniref:Uncharacterized protein n=1 Tax=Naganishia friedmannii TaxID=89922 RepID=A0ACC2W211_9TREE|nr:hypothetical protein QFC21_001782 [Naganishia friedmannii]
MPKVISRAAISSSDQAPATASSLAVLRTFYCLCGEFMLVIDRGLDKLPRRKTDGAYIIRCKDGANLPLQAARKFKLNAEPGQQCYIKRQGRIPPDAFDGEEAVALSQTDQNIRDELAANDDKIKGRMNDEMRKKLEKDRKMISGGGTTQEVVEREDSP